MTKHHRLMSSQIKLDNTTILWVFLLVLILNLSYHQTHIADELTYIIAKVQLEAICYCTITYELWQRQLAIYPLSVFSQLHGKHFEIYEKISCRKYPFYFLQKYPFYNTNSIERYVDLTRVMKPFSFFWKKLYPISLFFVQQSVIQLRYFWRNYILNKFSLLDSLLRLVCLLVAHRSVGSQLLHHNHRPAEFRYIFC